MAIGRSESHDPVSQPLATSVVTSTRRTLARRLHDLLLGPAVQPDGSLEPRGSVRSRQAALWLRSWHSVTEMHDRADGGRFLLPVSVKGVIWRDQRVCLLYNERGEWELPGGKLDRGETPQGCVAREIEEELGLSVSVAALVHAWVYRIRVGVEVFVVAYTCDEIERRQPRLSDEHRKLGWFRFDDLDRLPLPDGYRRAIEAAQPAS